MNKPGYVLASMRLDYAFANSVYVQTEVLYNGDPTLWQAALGLLNNQISSNALFLNGSYPVHPLVSVSLGGIQGLSKTAHYHPFREPKHHGQYRLPADGPARPVEI